jgi:alpha-D-xyloside xylohydrolase
VFSAHMRLHGIGPREPWSYGEEAAAAATSALELRYRLLPYLWAAVAQASATGLPVQRAMALACPDEPESWSFDHQFFCGDDLLVAPCLDPAGRVRVYLPEGDWRRFPGGERVAGGRSYRMQLALDEMAVFARAGAAIPLGPDVQHTGELGPAPRTLAHWTAT